MRKFLFIISAFLFSIFSYAQLGGLGDKLLKGKDPLQIKKPPITTAWKMRNGERPPKMDLHREKRREVY
jgi:hypothetical protein